MMPTCMCSTPPQMYALIGKLSSDMVELKHSFSRIILYHISEQFVWCYIDINTKLNLVRLLLYFSHLLICSSTICLSVML